MRYNLKPVQHGIILGLSLALLACDPNEEMFEGNQQNDEAITVGRDFVPENYRDHRSVFCQIPDKASTVREFTEGPLKGQKLHYYSSNEIDYSRTNWPWQKKFSWDILDGKLGVSKNQVQVVAIDIRNVNGVPHYHYFSNGTFNWKNQNYSSTKVLGQLGALHRLRLTSNGRIGGNSLITDDTLGWGTNHFSYYAYRLAHDSSNHAGGLFKNLAGLSSPTGGGLNATSFVRGWLSLPDQEFNGFYGYGGYDKYYRVYNGSRTDSVILDFTRESRSTTPNHLSPLTMAEYWKRLGVNFRDEKLLPKGLYKGGQLETYGYRSNRTGNAVNQYINDNANNWKTTITKEDLLWVFYGDGNPDSDNIGGMLHDIGIRYRFKSELGGVYKYGSTSQLDGWTKGQWRVWGKTGSNSSKGWYAYGAHVCLPHMKGGQEFAFFLLSKGAGLTAAKTVITKIVDSLAPGLRTEKPNPDNSNGGGGIVSGVPSKGVAIANYTTYLKDSSSDSSLPSTVKCQINKNGMVRYASISEDGKHYHLTSNQLLEGTDGSCPQAFNQSLFLYGPHFRFARECKTNVNDVANVRSEPRIDNATFILSLPNNHSVFVTDTVGEWYKVEFKDGYGKAYGEAYGQPAFMHTSILKCD